MQHGPVKREEPALRPTAGRVPPHNMDAEGAVLSAILMRPEAYDEVAPFLSSGAAFYSDANRHVYEAIVGLHTEGKLIDAITVANALQAAGRLPQVGGTPYLSRLVNEIPHVAAVGPYAEIVRDLFVKRQLIARAQVIAADAYTAEGTGVALVLAAEASLGELALHGVRTPLVRVSQVFDSELDRLTKAKHEGVTFTGADTGFPRLNEMTAGLHKGDLTIAAGRPGMGKSAFVLNLAANVARPMTDRRGLAVAFFSLEMPKEQLALRLACAEQNIDFSAVRAGRISDAVWPDLTAAAVGIRHMPIWIDDTPGITVQEMRTRSRKLQRDIALGRVEEDADELGLVVLDYLQLAQGIRQRGDSRESEVASLSRDLKLLAKDLGVPVVALSQLNRSVETRGGDDKRPQMKDLRECLAGGARVHDPRWGHSVPIAELARRGDKPRVLSFDGSSGQLVEAVGEVFPSGEKQVFRLRTATGREIRASGNHPFLTRVLRWKRLDALTIGEEVAVARTLQWRLTPENPILWDPIVAIEPEGIEPVYDLTVPYTHNFVANDFIVHNSGAIEQDADNIWFLYRDDYYDKQATPGEAELIIAKQRNGATGTVKLFFRGPSMRFFERAGAGADEDFGDFEGGL